ncbi:hypothetical protein GCM10020331_073420 [Ectobacillus funiculus]
MDIQRNINGQTKGIKELSANQFTDVIDYLFFNKQVKSSKLLFFYGYLYNNNKFKYCEHDSGIDLSNIKKSFNYFPLIDLRTVLFDLFEDWKFGNYEVLERDEKKM